MKKYLYLLFILTIFFFIRSNPANGQVVINEFSCSNLDQYTDNYGAYEDWIELYNAGASSVNLAGYYLSDDSTDNFKWKIPAGVTIGVHGFLIFWTSGRDTIIGTSYHTNFKLTQTKNNNEYIVLSNSVGIMIDYKEIKTRTQKGHSYGRVQNGSPNWGIFKYPTPNASNNTQTAYAAYAKKPDFSAPEGYYTGNISLNITSTDSNVVIHYTINGNLPTSSSPIVSGPLTLTTTSVVKAIAYSSDQTVLPGFIEFNTYFINVNHTLPVISVSGTELDELANGNSSLIPYGTFEYFATDKQRKAKTYGEFNRHGQDSWANSQRSIDFVSRDEMGYNYTIKEKLFKYSDRDKFQRVILRAAGDDNYPADHHPANAGSAHLRDAYVHMLAKKSHLGLDVRMAEKVIVYLNGQYWGVYDIRERCDDHDYTDYYYGQDKYHIQYIMVWGYTWAEYGGNQALNDWNTLYNYIMNNDMANQANFDYAVSQLDAASLVDYYIVNSFTVCSDWLNWNTAWWRGLNPDGTHRRWGYTLWDNDATFGHYINYTGIPDTTPSAQPCDAESLSGSSDPEGHIALLAKLRTNPAFNEYYIARQVDLWNTTFGAANMLSQLDSVTALIAPEMNQHALRWGGTYGEWYNNVQKLRNFIVSRCSNLSSGLMSCYSLTGPYDLTVDSDPEGTGGVKLNSITLDQLPWTGSYFGGIQTSLKAVPYPGYEFDSWTSLHHSFSPAANSDSVAFSLTSSDTVHAHYYYTSVPELMFHDLKAVAYPNVFSDEITLDYSLPDKMPVSVRLYTLQGKEINTDIPQNQMMSPGNYSLKINFHNTHLTGGMYILRFTAGGSEKSFKLIYSK